jgi:hypothetical protein
VTASSEPATYPVVGFSGTKDGVTAPQLASLETLFDLIPGARELHHGDCVGADDAAHHIATRLGWRIVVHPPQNQRRARGYRGNLRLPPLGFLARNHEIARLCDLLIACPAQPEHDNPRSGTWATVRHARRLHKPIAVIDPAGAVRWERPDLTGGQR